MSAIEKSIVDLMETLIRKMSKGFFLPHVNGDGIDAQEAVAQARHIVALLPKQLDPLLLQARALAQEHGVGDYMNGDKDDFPMVQVALAALRSARP